MVPDCKIFRIHGDNIVECERTLQLIKKSLQEYDLIVRGPFGNIFTPEFHFFLGKEKHEIRFTLFPGYNRWNEDIRKLGGILREAADAMVTRVEKKSEIPLIAIEFCGALPAGNQAWQRSGRAYSFGIGKIPYLYIADVGGYELDKNRKRKSERLPNPAVPFSYLSFSIYYHTASLPVFIASPGISQSSFKHYKSIFGYNELWTIIREIIFSGNIDKITQSLEQKTLNAVCLLADSRKKNDTLQPKAWNGLFKDINNGIPITRSIVNNYGMEWSKRATIKGLTETAREFMNFTSRYAFGLTSSNLPFCIISEESRKKWAIEVFKLYSDIDQSFKEWLHKDEDLVLCWIMGFKPRHDDARPDRGLAPFARMLIGNEIELLTIIYGPAPQSHWNLLQQNPGELLKSNGLWEAILASSDSIFIDSDTKTNSVKRAYKKDHWIKFIPKIESQNLLINPVPISPGENDIDTIIHTMFTNFGNDDYFEGMCNPPGGDWSGISVLSGDRTIEYRWLHLPRVSDCNGKRPDHVFQIFNLTKIPLILSIESKEKAKVVEKDVGPRLNQYVSDLFNHTPSIERVLNENPQWVHSHEIHSSLKFVYGSAVAFIINHKSEFDSISAIAKTDVIMGFIFDLKTAKCNINCKICTPKGEIIFNAIQKLQNPTFGITISKLKI